MSEGAPEGTGPQGTEPEGTVTPPAPTGTAPSTEKKSDEPDYKGEAERLREELKKFRRMEDQLKALRPKAQKFDEMQQAAMTAEERAQLAVESATAKATEAETRAAKAERDLARYKVAAKYKLGEGDLKFLKGIDTDELEEVAKDLAARLKTADIPDFDRGTRKPPPATNDIGDFLRSEINRATGRGRR